MLDIPNVQVSDATEAARMAKAGQQIKSSESSDFRTQSFELGIASSLRAWHDQRAIAQSLVAIMFCFEGTVLWYS